MSSSQEKVLCLEFCNTVSWHGSKNPKEMINSYSDLVVWSKKQNLLSDSSAQYLIQISEIDPKRAEQTLMEARNLRESLYRIFSTILHERTPEESDLKILNKEIANSYQRLQLVLDGSNYFQLVWEIGKNELNQMLYPIAKSAVDLLTSDSIKFVKECANETEGCGWLFIDSSKNHSRKWCSMNDCGNRSKVRNFYARKKSKKR
ncbi:MAG: CGNR zinc finger domain-containing protein [Nitrososphaerales archaeon]